MIILGIDPGLKNTGFGFLEFIDNKISLISCGVISTDQKIQLSLRLKTIFLELNELINTFKPQVAGIETIFINKNPQSSIMLIHARAVALVSCSVNDLKIYEFSPLEIKKSTTGYGNASKEQMKAMIVQHLKLANASSPDAIDALGVALTTCYQIKHSLRN